MADPDSDEFEADLGDWLKKTQRLKETVDKDKAAAEKDVDDKVRTLQRQIEHRLEGIATCDRQMEDVLQSIRRKNQQLARFRLDRDAFIDKNIEDQRQIDQLKSNEKKAQTRQRRVEEAILTLRHVVREPRANDPSAEKRPHESEPAEQGIQKRQRTEEVRPRETRSFDDVFNSDMTEHEILEYPKDSGSFFILECAEHGIKFGTLALAKATEHACSEAHSLNVSVGYPASIFDTFGVFVLYCSPEKANLNNRRCEEREEAKRKRRLDVDAQYLDAQFQVAT